MAKRDYYEILNIDKNASQDEVKRAYRNKAKKYHPDLNPDNHEAEIKFKEANEAYEILNNEEKRSRYDRFGHAGVDPQAGGYSQGFGGFEDIFGDIFDIFGGGGSRSRTRPTQGADIRYDLNLDFKEAVFGVEKEIQIRRTEDCGTCSGSGAKPGTNKETCTKCKGSGEVRYAQQTAFGNFVRTATCDMCDGIGEIIEEKCSNCRGTGKEVKNKKINVKVPAGVDEGSVISIRGEGEPGENGGPRGDLYIYLNIIADEVFKRSGNNIHLEIPITFTEASLGAKINVPTLEEIESYTIPAGTQTGTRFKLKNLGVPRLRGSGRGDLYFTVKVQIPTKLNEKQKELLLEFANESGEQYTENKKGFFEKVKDAFN